VNHLAIVIATLQHELTLAGQVIAQAASQAVQTLAKQMRLTGQKRPHAVTSAALGLQALNTLCKGRRIIEFIPNSQEPSIFTADQVTEFKFLREEALIKHVTPRLAEIRLADGTSEDNPCPKILVNSERFPWHSQSIEGDKDLKPDLYVT
jgi:hypothetical protein